MTTDVSSGPANLGSPRAWISYAHESDRHKEEVRAFADWLRERGVDVRLDQYESDRPPSSWPTWMLAQEREADFVLLIASPKYRERAEDKQEPGTGLGVKFEYTSIIGNIYRAVQESHKYIPVVINERDIEFIPAVLSETTFYIVGTVVERDSPIPKIRKDLTELYTRITGRSVIHMPPLGRLVDPQDLFPLSSSESSESTPSDNDEAQNAYVRGVRYLTEGRASAAIDAFRKAQSNADQSLRVAIRRALVDALVREKRYTEAHDVVGAASDDDERESLNQIVAYAESTYAERTARQLLERLQSNDPLLADLRATLHDAVVEELASKNVENQNILTAAGLPHDATVSISSVGSDYWPTDLKVDAEDPDDIIVSANITADVTLSAYIHRVLLGELSEELLNAATPMSGDIDDTIWEVDAETSIDVSVRVSYRRIESFTPVEIEPPKWGADFDW
jgi:hypothetical protein